MHVHVHGAAAAGVPHMPQHQQRVCSREGREGEWRGGEGQEDREKQESRQAGNVLRVHTCRSASVTSSDRLVTRRLFSSRRCRMSLSIATPVPLCGQGEGEGAGIRHGQRCAGAHVDATRAHTQKDTHMCATLCESCCCCCCFTTCLPRTCCARSAARSCPALALRAAQMADRRGRPRLAAFPPLRMVQQEQEQEHRQQQQHDSWI